MKISIDLDGVLAAFEQTVPRFTNKVPNNYIPTDWNWTDVLSEQDWEDIWERIRHNNNFWLSVPEYQENVTVLRDFWIKNPGLDIYFVTSRSETAGESVMVQTCQWLKVRELWPRNGHSSVIVVKQPSQKYKIMRALGIPFSLDDKPETVWDCMIKDHQPFLLNRSWNSGFKGNIVRVNSVAEYLGFVKRAMLFPETLQETVKVAGE